MVRAVGTASSVARQHLGLAVGVDVDHRRTAGHGDRFFEGAHFQIRVDGGGEIRRKLQPLTLEGLEAGECKCHDIRAGAEIDDPVLPLTIGRHGAGFFNEDIAGGFYRDTRKYGSRRVPDDTGNRALRSRNCRQQHHAREGDGDCCC
jgi:hypothetical protein